MRYLNDFFIVANSREIAQQNLDLLMATCQKAGFEIAENKLCLPTHRLKLMGLEIDSVSQTVRLTTEHRDDLITLITATLEKPCSTVRELQSLTGKLNFAGRAVQPGRTFLSSLDSLIHSSPFSLFTPQLLATPTSHCTQ